MVAQGESVLLYASRTACDAAVWCTQHGADITAKTVSGDSAATLSSHATDESMQRVVQNAMRVAKEEAAARGGDIGAVCVPVHAMRVF